jgi:hypothetical protein
MPPVAVVAVRAGQRLAWPFLDIARVAAGAFGFLTLIQVSEGHLSGLV